MNNLIDDMDVEDVLDTFNLIIKNILKCTRTIKKGPSVFDHVPKKRKISGDSDSTSDSLSSDEEGEEEEIESQSNIDKYDIFEFIEYCQERLGFDENVLILSMMNLDKFLKKDLVITEKNVHKVIFVCMMETQKFWNDESYSNKDYAKVCGISPEELFRLEYEFLSKFDFDLNIKEEDFFTYKNKFKNLWIEKILYQIN